MNGQIFFEVLPDSNVFLVTCEGMWSPDQARAHFDRMEGDVKRMRLRNQPVHVLVDLSAAVVQTQLTSHAMREGIERMHARADRVAIVGGSPLHGLQVKRDVAATTTGFFERVEDAMAWIRAADLSRG